MLQCTLNTNFLVLFAISVLPYCIDWINISGGILMALWNDAVKCPAEFTSAAKYEIHRSKHLGLTEFKCSECGKEFPDNYRLKYHIKNHVRTQNRKKVNIVSSLWKRFWKCWGYAHSFWKQALHREAINLCIVSEDIFGESLVGETYEGWYITEIGTNATCVTKVSQANFILHTHSRIHSGEKPFSCEICNKKFIVKVSMLTNTWVHIVSNLLKRLSNVNYATNHI